MNKVAKATIGLMIATIVLKVKEVSLIYRCD